MLEIKVVTLEVMITLHVFQMEVMLPRPRGTPMQQGSMELSGHHKRTLRHTGKIEVVKKHRCIFGANFDKILQACHQIATG